MELRDLFKVNEYKQENDKLTQENIELRSENDQLTKTYGGVTVSGYSVSDSNLKMMENDVLKIPTAQACVNLITGKFAQMPVYLYRENKDGSIDKIIEDERLKLLNDENEVEMESVNFMKLMVQDYLLHGQSHAYLNKKTEKVNLDGRIEISEQLIELNHLPSKNLQVEVFHNGYKYTRATYELTTMLGTPDPQASERKSKFNSDELLRVLYNPKNAYQGEGVLIRGRDVFKEALNQAEYTQNLYKRGALPLGMIKSINRLNQIAIDRLRESWNALYSGIKNSARTVILEEGMDYKPLSMNPSELQMNDSKKDINSEICKLFNVPESMITTANNKYNTIEQNNLNFLKDCLSPIIHSFESAFDRQLLTEQEKANGYFFRFDTSELLRTTETERTEALVKQLNAGLITLNEGRAVLDKKASDIGENFMISQGNVLMDSKTGEIKVLNMGLIGEEKQPVEDNVEESKPVKDDVKNE